MALIPVAWLFTKRLEFVKLFAKNDSETWFPISLVTLILAEKYGS